jgi:arsenate reductase
LSEMKKKVLFICVHNSARSQMAEAFLNHLCGDGFVASSAGLEPGKLNPVVVDVMHETGLDISGKMTRGVADVLHAGEVFDYVVTVCHESDAAGCPIFPGTANRLHWPFPDPSRFEGSAEEKMRKTREVRDLIRARVETWCAEQSPTA